MNTPAPALRISRDLFDRLADQLRRRSQGHRESGAFLLADASTSNAGGPIEITTVAYYDDLDPSSLTGNITFHADGYGALGQVCRDQHLEVVADIHTHPAAGVRQSSIDRRHPMIAIPGHIAFIAGHHAATLHHATQLGAHIFGGNNTWTSFYGDDVSDILTVTEPTPRWPARLRNSISHLVDHFRSPGR